jgi:hypothetical protein
MNERRLREALREAPIDEAAHERSWQLVRAAHRELPSQPPRRHARGSWLAMTAAACVVALIASAVATRTPADAVARWLRDAVGIGAQAPHPPLVHVPGGGRLLVTTGDDAWVVASDGTKRRLGRYDGASWSPRGLFVVAWRGGELVALEPNGQVRWSKSLRGSEAIGGARWAPGDGYRIAYLAGASLRVINGDGTGDRRYAPARADVAPAWQPGARHVLAYADPRGGVRVADVDLGRVLWRTAPFDDLQALAWSSRGDVLMVRTAHRLVWLDRGGARLRERALPAGASATAAAWSPRGAVALVRRDVVANLTEVVLLPAAQGPARALFTAPGTLGPVAWSPDGRLLLVSWPEGDQLLFLSPAGRPSVRPVGDVARQFAPGVTRGRFPSSVEWAPAPAP